MSRVTVSPSASSEHHAEPPAVSEPATCPVREETAQRWTRGAWAYPALFVGSIVESALIPWPIEFPLLAVMLRGRGHVFPAALVVIAGSAVGAVLAFLVGLGAYALIEPWIANRPGLADAIASAREGVAVGGAWAVFVGMMTPVPVQITSVAAGLAGVGPAAFALAAFSGRFVRYMAMAVPVFFAGRTLMAWWEKRSRAVKAALIGAFALAFLAALAAALV